MEADVEENRALENAIANRDANRANCKGEEAILEGRDTYKSIIQGLEKDKKEVAGKSKAFGQNDTKYIDKAINFLKQLEKEGIPANQISQVDFVTNRVPKFFIGRPSKSTSLSKFTPNDVKKAVAHAKKMGIIKEADVDENRALDNAIAKRDANRANRKGIEQYQDLYFGLQKLIRQVSKNNKVKGYGGELTHAFVDLLWAVEDDRLAVGEIFNALKKVKSKISKK